MYKKSLIPKTIKIVMLDHDKKLLTVVQTYFSAKKINIIPSQTANETYTTILQVFPDCIIVDTAIPNNIGYDLIHYVKTHSRLKYIPCIFLTTKGLTEDRIEGYKLGCNAYISKPFDPEELESIIRNLICQNKRTLNLTVEIYATLKKIRTELMNQYTSSLHNQRIPLTYDEYKILKKLLHDQQLNKIAHELKVTPRNIEKHISRILDKTNTKSTKQLKSLPWNLP